MATATRPHPQRARSEHLLAAETGCDIQTSLRWEIT